MLIVLRIRRGLGLHWLRYKARLANGVQCLWQRFVGCVDAHRTSRQLEVQSPYARDRFDDAPYLRLFDAAIHGGNAKSVRGHRFACDFS